VIDPDEITNVWKRYMEKLLDEENVWDGIIDPGKEQRMTFLLSGNSSSSSLKLLLGLGPTGLRIKELKIRKTLLTQ
jgi:hypothetical protein